MAAARGLAGGVTAFIVSEGLFGLDDGGCDDGGIDDGGGRVGRRDGGRGDSGGMVDEGRAKGCGADLGGLLAGILVGAPR